MKDPFGAMTRHCEVRGVEVLRLKHVAGQSERRIAAAVGISRYMVAEYLRRAMVVGITWPVPAELDDSTLEALLFSPPFAVQDSPRPQPDGHRLHAELRRPGVTLLLLWEEYLAGQPEGYGYSCYLESADFSVIFWQPVPFAHGRESTARIAGRVR